MRGVWEIQELFKPIVSYYLYSEGIVMVPWCHGGFLSALSLHQQCEIYDRDKDWGMTVGKAAQWRIFL
jgi:hypothetical protein